jgi:VanZ family protein
MLVQKNVANLSAHEMAQYIKGVKQLKAHGVYDQYVQAHLNTQRPDGTNVAHRGRHFSLGIVSSFFSSSATCKPP